MFDIVYRSQWGKEVVDTADTRQEAEYLRGEYMLAFNSSNITITKGRKDE